MTSNELDTLFVSVENAVDQHSKLERDIRPVGGSCFNMSQPTLHMSRNGASVHMNVKVRGSRKKPFEISGMGDTPEEAATKLIESLNTWAEVLSNG